MNTKTLNTYEKLWLANRASHNMALAGLTAFWLASGHRAARPLVLYNGCTSDCKPIRRKKHILLCCSKGSSIILIVGRGEAIYRSFSFHGINIWNYLKMHVPIDVSYKRFIKLNTSYLITNDIVYRIKS